MSEAGRRSSGTGAAHALAPAALRAEWVKLADRPQHHLVAARARRCLGSVQRARLLGVGDDRREPWKRRRQRHRAAESLGHLVRTGRRGRARRAGDHLGIRHPDDPGESRSRPAPANGAGGEDRGGRRDGGRRRPRHQRDVLPRRPGAPPGATASPTSTATRPHRSPTARRCARSGKRGRPGTLAVFSLGVGAVLRHTAGAITTVLALLLAPVIAISFLPEASHGGGEDRADGGGPLDPADDRDGRQPPARALAGLAVVAAYAAVALLAAFW